MPALSYPPLQHSVIYCAIESRSASRNVRPSPPPSAGQSEWYYATRDVIRFKTGQAIAKGDVVGVMKGLSGLDLPDE